MHDSTVMVVDTSLQITTKNCAYSLAEPFHWKEVTGRQITSMNSKENNTALN